MSSTTTTTATWLEADSEEDIKTTDSDKNSIIHLKSKNNVMSLIEAPLSGTIFLHCPVQLDEDFQVKSILPSVLCENRRKKQVGIRMRDRQY